MARTAGVRMAPQSLTTRVAVAIRMPALITAAFVGLAVANRRRDWGLGPPWRIVTVAMCIALWWVLIFGGGATDPQASTVALRVSVPVA
jgi:hypothetical protein